MRRLSGLVLAGALVLLPAFSQGHAVAQDAPKLTFEGDTALWTVSIKPDKTADFEKILGKLREGLAKSEKPGRKQQAAGWRVMKMAKPLQDGNIAYVHIINPVVSGADYTIMQVLYDEFPEERQALYDLYRAAFGGNVQLLVGNLIAGGATP